MLRARVARLEARVQALERTVQQLQERVKQLQNAIRAVQGVCLKVVAEANQIMNGGGVPRGTWSYAKGGKAVAAQVLALLGIGTGAG